jgi:FKBP-type peptidyl-prolyl cis-trans isomerase (trigger factor)
VKELQDSARADALREIKEFVILREIAEAEGIEVADADFEEHAADLATSAGVDKEIALGYLLGEEQRGRTETNILHKKVFDVILEHATIVDKELKDEEPAGAQS